MVMEKLEGSQVLQQNLQCSLQDGRCGNLAEFDARAPDVEERVPSHASEAAFLAPSQGWSCSWPSMECPSRSGGPHSEVPEFVPIVVQHQLSLGESTVFGICLIDVEVWSLNFCEFG